jgi:hypothetical protein
MNAAYVRLAAHENVLVDIDQTDYKHYMRSSGPGAGTEQIFLHAIGLPLTCFSPIVIENTTAARVKAESWIATNLNEAVHRACNRDFQGAAEALGRALHTRQDQYAHTVQDTGEPAYWYQHCSQGMDAGWYLYTNPAIEMQARIASSMLVGDFMSRIPIAAWEQMR